MKSKRCRNVIAAGFILVALLLTLNSCSKKNYFTTSTVVPAARGYVKIKKDRNENYTIELSVVNLAEVERLQVSRKVYVVWMLSGTETPKNLGQVNSGTRRFSKKLNASFHSVSATKPTRIFITAEDDGTVQYPGNFEVLTTEIM